MWAPGMEPRLAVLHRNWFTLWTLCLAHCFFLFPLASLLFVLGLLFILCVCFSLSLVCCSAPFSVVALCFCPLVHSTVCHVHVYEDQQKSPTLEASQRILSIVCIEAEEHRLQYSLSTAGSEIPDDGSYCHPIITLVEYYFRLILLCCLVQCLSRLGLNLLCSLG